MIRRITILILLACMCLPAWLSAQEGIQLEGKITDRKTGEPVIGAAVNLKDLDIWTVSDTAGRFVFNNVRQRHYTIEVQCLCYERTIEEFDVIPGQCLHLELVPTSYDMQEVSVLAKKSSNIATSTTIGSAAIEHIQATGLKDIMQLLPGNLAENPDLSGPQQISIREIGTDRNSAMGTSILVDNAPLSNDANLQVMSTSVSRSGEFNTVADRGVDLRRISSDNIESVEVIKGIPSVVYGNLTSGAVVVKTKAGYSPLEVRLKTDPKIKQVAVGKGFRIPNNKGFLNANVDYLSSYTDVVSKYKGYKRLTAQTNYSNTLMKATTPLTLNARFNLYGTLDNYKTDPDAMVAQEEYSTSDQGLRLNLGGKWSLNKKLLTDINYTFSVSYSHEVSYQMKYRTSSGGVTPISIARKEGENYGIYLPTEQLTELTVDGKPLDIFGQVTFNKTHILQHNIINKLLGGAEYRYDGNLGDGQLYDIANPPFISNSASRPRSFKEIPTLQSYSLYLEDKLILPLGTTKLNLQGGFRLNNFQPESVVNSQVGWYLEPRLNASYEILNNRNNSIFQILTINAGIGKTYKSPTLLYLYPDRAYYDLPVLDYYTGDPATQTAVFYSMNFETGNPDLQPSENLKKEVGIDFHLGPVAGNITAFSENLENGFDLVSKYEFITGYRYVRDSIPDGTKPDLSKLPVETFDHILSYLTPVNNQRTVKSGIEFSFDFGKIKTLYTEFRVDGAYLRTTRYYSTVDYPYLPSSASPKQYPNIGMYPAGESKISERFNTNLRMVTQVPQLRMVLSTTFQVVWIDNYWYPFYDEAPLYLFDKDGTIKEYTDEMRTDPDFMRYYDDKTQYYYLTESLPPLFLANIRLSKEIEDKMVLSMFVNNFMNYRPMHQYIRTESYTRRNPSIYFGAEIKFRI
ncbi:MAG: TonB-dependent receptor plug domain-containing protein [Bacteroidales bacterium]|nr:TonB-dependent receptor plug domain-containing protein [Bacteroidales bacterium]MDT8430759.1 TonB-dependent receptor plug domain-containing protein [Bacteroidales bacterium]